jgi:hypothetical protein
MGGRLEVAQQITAHERHERRLYDRRVADDVSLDKVESIRIQGVTATSQGTLRQDIALRNLVEVG